MGLIWRRFNLATVLFALFAVSWLVQTVAGWREFAVEQATHGEAALILGNGGYG